MDLNFEDCSFVAAPTLSDEGQLGVIGLLARAGIWCIRLARR